MTVSTLRVEDIREKEDVQTEDSLEIAMARFGYAVAGLGEKDLMAVVELVERLTLEIRNVEGRG